MKKIRSLLLKMASKRSDLRILALFSFLWGGKCGGGEKKFDIHKIYTIMSSHTKIQVSTPKNGFTDPKGRKTA